MMCVNYMHTDNTDFNRFSPNNILNLHLWESCFISVVRVPNT